MTNPNMKFTTTITKAEAAAEQVAEQSQARFAAAPLAYAVAQQEAEEATDHLATVEAGFRRGSGEHTDTDHAVAVSAVRRTELREIGAKREVEASRQALTSSDTEVAHAVRQAVGSAVADGALIVTHVTPSASPRRDERPVVVLTQEGPTEYHASGMIGADLTLRIYLTEHHKPLSAELVQAALDRAGIFAHVGRSREQGGGLHLLTIKVSGATAGEPVIPSIETTYVRRLGNRVALDAVSSSVYYDEQVRADHFTGLFESKRLAATAYGTPVVTEVIEDGRRTLTLETKLSVRHKTALDNGATVLDVLSAEAGKLQGQMIGHLGVVQFISVAAGDESDEGAARQALHRAGVLPGSSELAMPWVITATLTSLTEVADTEGVDGNEAAAA